MDRGGTPKKKKLRSRGKECAAAGCSNFEYNNDGSRSGLHFFKFPTKGPAKTRWCNLIKRQNGRDGFFVNQNTVICEKHFKKEDIHRALGGVRHKLKEGAEPTIFTWSSASSTPKSARRPPKVRPFTLTTQMSGVISRETGAIPSSSGIGTTTNGNKETESNSSFPLLEMEVEQEIPDTHTTGESSSVLQPSTRQTDDKCTQTEWSFVFPADGAVFLDHSYAFDLRESDDQGELKQAMKERLEVKEEMLVNLKMKVGQLQKELQHHQERVFSLETFKGDNAAIQFYTGFPNYEALIAFHNYIAPKVAKLQYWGKKHVAKTLAYQEEDASV